VARTVPEATFAIGSVRAMPFGRARSEAAARQVRLAEAEGPDEVRAYALETFIEALTWVGESQQALVPFIKLLRWWDTHPEFFDAGDQNIMFWEFGWIVNDMGRTSSVPAERVDKALDDMAKRFALANRGMERVWNARLEWAMISGSDDVDKVFSSWLTMPVDDEDSCQPCHDATHAGYLLFRGDRDGAMAILETAVASEVRCSKEPASMLAMLAWCYLEMDRLDDVEKLLSQVVVELSSATSLSVLTAQARLFEIFARGQLYDRAVGLMGKIAQGMATSTEFVRLDALRSLWAGLACLVAQGHGDQEVVFDGQEFTVGELLAKTETDARQLATQFDDRHSIDIHRQKLSRISSVTSTSRPLVFQQYSLPEVPTKNRPRPLGTHGSRTRLQAEGLHEKGYTKRAIAHYYLASEEAQARGNLLEAGWCIAEAARLHQNAGQLIEAGKDYLKAVTYLQAAGIKLEEIVPLFVAWAPGVQSEHYQDYLAQALVDYPSPAQEQFDLIIHEVPPHAVNRVVLSSPMVKRFVRVRSELKDAVARVMATWGSKDDQAKALDMAEESATWMDALGYTDYAAHTWWLAGRLGALQDSPSTNESFTWALRGFSLAGKRGTSFGRLAVEDYAVYLREKGRESEAAEFLQMWAKQEELF